MTGIISDKVLREQENIPVGQKRKYSNASNGLMDLETNPNSSPNFPSKTSTALQIHSSAPFITTSPALIPSETMPVMSRSAITSYISDIPQVSKENNHPPSYQTAILDSNSGLPHQDIVSNPAVSDPEPGDSDPALPSSDFKVSVTTVSPEWAFLAGGEKVRTRLSWFKQSE